MTSVAGPVVQVEWRHVAGSVVCAGCDRGPIPAGTRALYFRRGPRGTDRIIGQSFHGYACLGRRAEECAWEEEGRGSGRSEAYREVERWASEEERRRRSVPY